MADYADYVVVDNVKLNKALFETANAIRKKAGSEDLYSFDESTGFKSAVESIETGGDYDQGYEDGKNSVVDNAKYAKTITFTSLNVFGKEEVELTLNNITKLESLFDVRTLANKNTTVKNLIINSSSQPTSLLQMIYSIGSSSDDSVLERLTLNFDTSKCISFKDFLAGRAGLRVIDGEPLNFSGNTQSNISGFTRCALLQELRVVKESIKHNFGISNCSLLSAETKQSIFEGLAVVETAQTLTLHANLKILQSQVDSANAKGWTVAGGIVVSEEEYYAE